MTPKFDEFDKDLREALASEALPPAGFTDRVMARVAETRPVPPVAGVCRRLPGGGRSADPAAARRRSGQQGVLCHGCGGQRC